MVLARADLLSLQSKRDKFAGLSRKAKRRRILMEEDKASGDGKAMNAAIRSAKKASRPPKIGLPARRQGKMSLHKTEKRPSLAKTKGLFERDLDQKSSRREGIR